MTEEIEKLKSLTETEKISEVIDIIRAKIHSYGKEELDEFFDVAIKLIKTKKGIISKKLSGILSASYPKLRMRIVSMLWSEDPYVRNMGLKIIAENKDREILHTLMKDKDRDIRKFALDIAYEINYPEILKVGLDDPDVNVMVSAAEYLSYLGDTSGIAKIEEKIRSLPKDDIWTASFLIQSLINLEYEKTAEIIKQKFDINDPFIKPFYISACGVSKNDKYLPEILQFLKDTPEVRKQAIDSLIKLLRSIKIPPEIKDKVRSAIEEIVPKVSPEELEMIKRVQDILSAI